MYILYNDKVDLEQNPSKTKEVFECNVSDKK